MKAPLLCITLLTTGLAFAAEEHQIGKANRFALLFDRIADSAKHEDKKKEDVQEVNKNSRCYVPTFDKDGNEILDRRRQPAINFGGPSGFGMMASAEQPAAQPIATLDPQISIVSVAFPIEKQPDQK